MFVVCDLIPTPTNYLSHFLSKQYFHCHLVIVLFLQMVSPCKTWIYRQIGVHLYRKTRTELENQIQQVAVILKTMQFLLL